MKQSQMNFKEIRLALLLFLPLSPSQASHSQALPSSFSNPEKDRENRKKAWFIRLKEIAEWNRGRRGLEAETDAEVIESENLKLNIEENVVGLPL